MARHLFTVLLFVCGILPAWSLANFSMDGNGSNAGRPIGKNLFILEDEDGTLTPEQAMQALGYKRSEQDVPNLGCTPSTFWLRTTLLPTGPNTRMVLHIPHPEIDELDIYRIKEGRPVHIVHNGQARKYADIFPQQREFFFELEIDHVHEVLIRVKSIKQLQVPILFKTSTEARIRESTRKSYAGIYIGMMLVLAFYNLFIYLSTKDQSYLRYVIYLLLVFFTQLAFYGVAPDLLWPDNHFLLTRSSLLLTIFTAVAATAFISKFLRAKENAPQLYKGIPVFYAAFVVSIALYFSPWPWFGYQVAQAVSGIYAFYVLAIVTSIWRKGSRAAGFFLVAWSVFLIGTMVFVMKDAGVLPYNEWTVHMMPLGSAVEGVLLSLALADRINILRKEKEFSQAQSLRISKENERIILEQNYLLEQKVLERTHALQRSNEDLKQTQSKLVNAEKMASLGQLTAGIAHEINNPINFITSNIQPLRRNIKEIVQVMKAYREVPVEKAGEVLPAVKAMDQNMGISESIEELDSMIDSIAEGSSRTAQIVRGLRNFSRLDESDLKEADINEGLRNTITVLNPQYREKVKIETDLGDIPPVECFPGKVNQVFMNILTNAVQATMARQDNEQRTVQVRTHRTHEHVIISIRDNGIGMSEEVKARIYDPFFTTKPVGEGTGLGMAIVYGIVEEHAGHINLESTPGIGTEFIISLPIRHMSIKEKRA